MRRSPRFGDVKMLPRVAAICFAAFVIIWPARSGLDSGTLDAFSPAAALVPPAQNLVAGPAQAEPDAKIEAQVPPAQRDDAPAKMTAFDPAEPTLGPPPVAEPFGLAAAAIADGDVLTKWSGVEAEIRNGNEILARCRDDLAQCPAPAKDFLSIVAQGRAQTGRARIGVINRAVNLAIEPMSDLAQWGVPDRWSAPLETMTTHRGDCEDYAIAKYVALTAAGVAAEDVKLVIVRNTAANEDHAIVAVRDDSTWIVLDNRWLTLVDDVAMSNAVPLFVLDGAGVRKFVPTAMSAARRTAVPASLGF
jgi:predicted transglutaminase-like cysteine proteinase